MFVIDLTYISSLDEIDQHMSSHVKFLDKYYKEDIFLMSGRKKPRTGGIIIAQADSLKEIEQIMQHDPFYKHKLATFTVTEFNASQTNTKLKSILKT
ncbi:GTP cyclohydrolase [Pedobacter sp. HMF7647]|uniref:GTP cyclohydrolase n=1 Tax=Hufsiella arboris TaxID=2695275 RepID=A0A7K1YEJ5_9SPHI|nr:YciI family protein [Hufsiella arboris]MXV53015.1 GTP cyclohydrolase [Hufsiella arboris]